MTNTGIEAFLAICRCKSISRAAEELCISQSSLSIRLRILEDELGCRLLLRGKGSREMTLTEEGQAFSGLAMQYQTLVKRMENIGKAHEEEHLSVSTISSVGNYVLPPVYESFTRKYPNVKLTVQEMEAELACLGLINGKTDVAFSTSNVQTDQIISVPFLTDPLVIIAPGDADLPDPVPLSALSVNDEVYIKCCADQEYWHKCTFGSDAAPKINLGLMEQLKLFVSAPKSWAVVPRTVAAALSGSPDIKMLRPGFYIPDRVVYILRGRQNGESENILRFLSVLRETLAESGVSGLLL
jgi:DNA-binding transcriptional LysR family regulator